MPSLQLVVAAGLFSLGGVALGALLTPLTQLFLERKREARAADRARLLVAGELLHLQLTLRAVSKLKHWPAFGDVQDILPTSIWHKNRSSLVGNVSEDLWNRLVMAYAVIETDRARLIFASSLPPTTDLPAKEAEGIEQLSNDVGRLRRELGGGGGWLDEEKGGA